MTDDADHDVFEVGGLDGASEERQGVHTAGFGIDDVEVVVLPAGLVLLGTAVMVDGEQHGPRLARRRTQIHRRLPAIGADLEQRTEPSGDLGGVVQREPFVVGHESLGRTSHVEQAFVHHGRAD